LPVNFFLLGHPDQPEKQFWKKMPVKAKHVVGYNKEVIIILHLYSCYLIAIIQPPTFY